jgi:hypothetical protein
VQICYHRNGDLRWEQIKGSSKVARVNASPLVYGPVQLGFLGLPPPKGSELGRWIFAEAGTPVAPDWNGWPTLSRVKRARACRRLLNRRVNWALPFFRTILLFDQPLADAQILTLVQKAHAQRAIPTTSWFPWTHSFTTSMSGNGV